MNTASSKTDGITTFGGNKGLLGRGQVTIVNGIPSALSQFCRLIVESGHCSEHGGQSLKGSGSELIWRAFDLTVSHFFGNQFSGTKPSNKNRSTDSLTVLKWAMPSSAVAKQLHVWSLQCTSF